jgi:hypothetical protein
MVATQGNTPNSERPDRSAPQPPNKKCLTAELVSALTCKVLPWFEPGPLTEESPHVSVSDVESCSDELIHGDPDVSQIPATA